MTANALPTEPDSRVERITGVVLAGGLGRRMGGLDKGLLLLDGQPMAERVLDRLCPQVDDVLINANQNIETYAAFGYPVISDRIAGFAGPLAGLHAALSATVHPLVVTVPCDSPFLPGDLVSRLSASLQAGGADLAVARTFSQVHPVFCLCRQRVLSHLTAFLVAGGRKVDQWYQTLQVIEVAFDDVADAFRNINTPDELTQHSLRP